MGDTTTIKTEEWNKTNLEKALNVAIAVELFTIPVYLSAAASIKTAHRKDKTIPVTIKDGSASSDGTQPTKTENFSAYDVIMSVAIQEMFHLTLACNLCNAMGIRPNIVTPNLDSPPSCLSGIKNMPVRGNLSQLIDTMVAIEAPDVQYIEPPLDPLQPAGPTKYQEQYNSIGDLYHALAHGVSKLWKYDADNDAYQKKNFQGKYAEIKHQVMQKLDDALVAMACITEQGEGIGLGKFMSPEYIPTSPGAMFHDLDEVDHWHRFLDIQTYLNTAGNSIPQYEASLSELEPTVAAKTAADELMQNYSILIQQMHYNFRSTNAVDLRGMAQTLSFATKVFENGGVPQWNTNLPTPWPVIVNPHSCQGLNECKGQGYSNSGTGAGDGACATASTHGCTTTNACANQGGCGFPGKTAKGEDQWTPRENTCKTLGGCMVPISPDQYFPLKAKGNINAGKNVWQTARNMFAAKYAAANGGAELLPCGEVTSRRKSQTPNSPKGS